MNSYRDYLNDRGIPPAGWVTLADGRPAYTRGEDLKQEAEKKRARVRLRSVA